MCATEEALASQEVINLVQVVTDSLLVLLWQSTDITLTLTALGAAGSHRLGEVILDV